MKYNMKSAKICGFCKNWFDPACSVIEPVSPVSGLWDVKTNIKKPCLKRNAVLSKADFHCGYFEKKSI